uniref:cytochrome b6-f complex subunit PetP n=1 Tax=Aphanocladia delicatula TaxID=3041656 RepID=UPI002551DCF1|nr:cytochrome b6-f complex subunit PetP [Aphanocladia delicatula]WGH14260.1 cytochrome b6-f complex subunit PetP [Aphanocladia delicatula]
MQRYLVKIKFIPNNIKKKISEKLYKSLKFVGYKKISKDHIVPIIQFSNKKRIWILIKEIV